MEVFVLKVYVGLRNSSDKGGVQPTQELNMEVFVLKV